MSASPSNNRLTFFSSPLQRGIIISASPLITALVWKKNLMDLRHMQTNKSKAQHNRLKIIHIHITPILENTCLVWLASSIHLFLRFIDHWRRGVQIALYNFSSSLQMDSECRKSSLYKTSPSRRGYLSFSYLVFKLSIIWTLWVCSVLLACPEQRDTHCS